MNNKKIVVWIILGVILALIAAGGTYSCRKKKTNEEKTAGTSTPVVTIAPTAEPTAEATEVPKAEPTAEATAVPTAEPTAMSTETPEATELATEIVTATPTAMPTATVKATATAKATVKPTATPTASLYTRDGDYITFGSYPQSEVTDSILRGILNTLGGSTDSWTSYNYYIETCEKTSDSMRYKDVTYKGVKYRGVYFTEYRPFLCGLPDYGGSQETSGYSVNTVYWFKFEPIKWKILSETKDDAFLFADMLLDSQNFDVFWGTSDYAKSYIREWLNDNFYNWAFTSTEKNIIKTTTVDNSAASTSQASNPYICEDTKDKVFLLSYAEVTNESLGFNQNERSKKLTEYAKSQGATPLSFEGGNNWWLRTPCGDTGDDEFFLDTGAYRVMYDGRFKPAYVYKTNFCVAPALHITL